MKKDCNCKKTKNMSEVADAVREIRKQNKLTFFVKLKIMYEFFVFYFIYVNSSLVNFMFTNKLEPVFPKKLLDKYLNGNG